MAAGEKKGTRQTGLSSGQETDPYAELERLKAQIKQKEREMATPEERIAVMIPEPLKTRLKLCCVKRKIDMKDAAREALTAWCDQNCRD